MPNPFFAFKQFTIHHDRCAMKVGTDGVLLVKNSRSVTFIPVSSEKSPLKNEVIYLIILFIVSSLKM